MRSQPRALVPYKGALGFFQRARAIFGGVKEYAQSQSWSFNLLDHDLVRQFFSRGSHTGRNVTDDFAMAVSTVWRCCQLRAQTIGSLPWAVYERLGPNQVREADDHPLTEVLVHSPNLEMDRMQFREAISANLDLRGNSYSLKETRSSGHVSSLTPLPSRKVRLRRNRASEEIEYVFMDRGKEEIFPREKIWHIRRFSFDGLVGLSALSYGRNAIGLSAGMEEYGAKFFANGARVSGVVRIPQWLEDDQRKKAKENLETLYSGLDNAHKLMLLEGGMEYEQTSIAPEDAQFLASREFSVPEICRYFGVPPHLAFDLRHGSYNNVETLAGEWVTFGLLPDLARIEISAGKQLLPPGDRRQFFVRFNFEGLLRANSLERSQFYAAMLQNGVFSRNEVREKENLSRIEAAGMDDRTVQTNLAMIQFLDAMVRAGVANGRGDPAGGDKAGTNVNVSMPAMTFSPHVAIPEELKHQISHGASAELKAMFSAIERLAAGQAHLQDALGSIAKVAAMPRKPVFDADGRLLGAVPVEKL